MGNLIYIRNSVIGLMVLFFIVAPLNSYTQCEDLAINLIEQSNNSCFSDCNGMIEIEITGGIQPIDIEWSNGETASSINDMCAGDYSVIVEDANGCIDEATFTITEPSELDLEVESTDICFDVCNGSASVEVNGGIPPYTVEWQGEHINPMHDSVLFVSTCEPEEELIVIVTDANGCSASETTQIDQLSPISISVEGASLSCDGDCDGYVEVNASGSAGGFEYEWDGLATTSNYLDNLCPQELVLTATDVRGCSKTQTIEITEPGEIELFFELYNTNCYWDCAGGFNINTEGATSPFLWEWTHADSTFQTSQGTMSGICPGDFEFTLTDANGCVVDSSFTIIQEEECELFANGVVTLSDFPADCESSAFIDVVGGEPPYSFYVSNGDSTQSIEGLCPGVYEGNVTDADGEYAYFMFIVPNEVISQGNSDDDSPAADSLFSAPVEECGIDFDAPVDSFYIEHEELHYGVPGLYVVTWYLYQGGESFIHSEVYYSESDLDTDDVVFALSVYCDEERSLVRSMNLYFRPNSVLSVGERSSNEIGANIFPNPATDNMTIELIGNANLEHTETEIAIFDISGSLILTEYTNDRLTNIGIQSLAKGVYFIKISQGSKPLLTQKLIKL